MAVEEGTGLAFKAFARHPELARDLGEVMCELAVLFLAMAAEVEAAGSPRLLQRRLAVAVTVATIPVAGAVAATPAAGQRHGAGRRGRGTAAAGAGRRGGAARVARRAGLPGLAVLLPLLLLMMRAVMLGRLAACRSATFVLLLPIGAAT